MYLNIQQSIYILFITIRIVRECSAISNSNVHVIENSSSSGTKSYHTTNGKITKNNGNSDAGAAATTADLATGAGMIGTPSGYTINGMLVPPMMGMSNPGLISPGIVGTNIGMMTPGLGMHIPIYPGSIGHHMGIYNTGGGGAQQYATNQDYEQTNKNVNDNKYEKAGGNQAQSEENSSGGFQEKKVAEKDNNVEKGHYLNQSGGEKNEEDSKSYEGSKNYNKEGKFEEFQKTRKGYRKGHNKKGAKASHTKDASEKTETFYDEAHDEADNSKVDGIIGTQSKKEGASYQGGQNNDKYNNEKSGQNAGFEKVSILDNSKGEKGQYGQEGYKTNNQMFGTNLGVGFELSKGHSEKDGLFKNFGSSFPSLFK